MQLKFSIAFFILCYFLKINFIILDIKLGSLIAIIFILPSQLAYLCSARFHPIYISTAPAIIIQPQNGINTARSIPIPIAAMDIPILFRVFRFKRIV